MVSFPPSKGNEYNLIDMDFVSQWVKAMLIKKNYHMWSPSSSHNRVFLISKDGYDVAYNTIALSCLVYSLKINFIYYYSFLIFIMKSMSINNDQANYDMMISQQSLVLKCIYPKYSYFMDI